VNIQIFGQSKCFDTKKAERYFKERGIKFQSIDLVKQAVGGIEQLIDSNAKDKNLLALLKYLSSEDKEDKLLENPKLFKTPIVRNGKQATVGFQAEVWKNWE